MTDLIPEHEWLEELELTPDELKGRKNGNPATTTQHLLEEIEKDIDHNKKKKIDYPENSPTQEPEKRPMGRPKKHHGKTKRLTMDIPAELHKQLKQVVLDRDQTMTELITTAIDGIIKAHEKTKK